MKNILEYTSYRQYIADYYADRKAKSAFTWQEFAASAGFSSPVYLKYVSEGRFNLSEAAADRMARLMHLADYEREFFVEMVKFDHAKNDAQKRAAFSKMVAIGEARKAKIVDAESFRFFEDWKKPVLRELAPAMPGAKPLALAHACRAKVSAAEVSETLSFLIKADLLKKDENGNYVKVKRHFKKKSAWQKLSRAFNVDTAIVDRDLERTKTGRIKEAYYCVRATLPNGRSVESDALCSRSERGKDKVSDHTIMSTAKTRATNRAIAELIGAGEVSAEEMSAEKIVSQSRFLKEDVN